VGDAQAEQIQCTAVLKQSCWLLSNGVPAVLAHADWHVLLHWHDPRDGRPAGHPQHLPHKV